VNLAQLRNVAHRGLALLPSPGLRHQPGGRYAFRDGVAFYAWGLPGPSSNKAAVLGPAPSLERILGMGDEFFRGVDGGYGIMVEADAGHPVEDGLRQAGWQVLEDEPALVLADLSVAPPDPPNLAIEPVRDMAGRRDLVEVVVAGFGTPTADADPGVPLERMDDAVPSLAAALDPDLALLVGYCDGRPVATAMLLRVEEIAVIAGVATVPGQRRRGFGRAVTWAAVREGARRGCRHAALNALGASYPLYCGMGFVHVCNHRTYVPAGTGADRQASG
jgi:GNAT superfamily N-acetyltransferase